MILVGREAPDFTVPAIFGNGKIVEKFNFKKYIEQKIAVIFFWPLDFTFVCPSELISCNKRYSQFQKRHTEVVGVSIDSVFVHNAWRNTSISQGGIGKVNFPMVSDLKRDIIKTYGIEHPTNGIALRASFLIDKLGIIRHQVINDLPFGRNFDEMLRMVDALQFHEKFGLLCPAQWNKDIDGLKPNSEETIKYLTTNFDKL